MAGFAKIALQNLLIFIFLTVTIYATDNQKRRFEYKLSFKGPHLVTSDGYVPFWEHGGHAIASEDFIRITPSLRSKKGFVWAKNKNTAKNWEIEVKLRVTGRGRVGADGLGIWYTSDRAIAGPVFGNQDKWNGLGLFFDSFDNDAQHNNPYIMAMYNDGTQNYDHQSDGLRQQLGGCLRDFRNKPFVVRAKISYFNDVLQVFIHSGMSNNEQDYELCMRAENVHLPAEGYFGVTAATGALADDHDVLSFLTHSLTEVATGTVQGDGKITDDEKKKLEKEFDEYWDKLQKAKDEYKKEHPNQVKKDEFDEEKAYERPEEREMKMIMDAINALNTNMRDVGRKIDEVIGRQERTMSQISGINVNAGAGTQQGGTIQQQQHDTIKRHEIDEVVTNMRESLTNIRDLKNTLGLVHDKTSKLSLEKRSDSPFETETHELKDMVNNIKENLHVLIARPTGGNCPSTSCVSSGFFITLLITQTFVILGYLIFKSKQDTALKKFY